MNDKEKALVLRTCAADMTARGGFVWPESGPVECPDWDPDPICGHGLHGLLWGEGDGSMLSWEPAARWLVVEVDADSIVSLGQKVKFPRGEVVHCGNQQSATRYLYDHGVEGRAIVGGTATAGNRGTATAGDGGTATAGYGGAISILWWDGTRKQYRRLVGEIGEGGLVAGKRYRVVDGKFKE